MATEIHVPFIVSVNKAKCNDWDAKINSCTIVSFMFGKFSETFLQFCEYPTNNKVYHGLQNRFIVNDDVFDPNFQFF